MVIQTPPNPDSHVVVPKAPQPHTKTLILLHGTSTSGPELAVPLLSTSFTSTSSHIPTTLPAFFPTCKFIFPTGASNPTTVFNGRETHAWFDVHSFADRTIGDDSLAFRSQLRASVRYLTALIKEEVEILERQAGEKGKVVLLGFSQGAAVANTLLLSGELEKAGVASGLAGVVGMSGWLPLRSQIEESIKNSSDIYDGVDEEIGAKRMKARGFLRRYLDLDDYGEGIGKVASHEDGHNDMLDIPIFLGHGKIDEKVRLEWALQMADVLLKLGLNVQRKVYDALAHWWNEKEITEVAEFLERVWDGDIGSIRG